MAWNRKPLWTTLKWDAVYGACWGAMFGVSAYLRDIPSEWGTGGGWLRSVIGGAVFFAVLVALIGWLTRRYERWSRVVKPRGRVDAKPVPKGSESVLTTKSEVEDARNPRSDLDAKSSQQPDVGGEDSEE